MTNRPMKKEGMQRIKITTKKPQIKASNNFLVKNVEVN